MDEHEKETMLLQNLREATRDFHEAVLKYPVTSDPKQTDRVKELAAKQAIAYKKWKSFQDLKEQQIIRVHFTSDKYEKMIQLICDGIHPACYKSVVDEVLTLLKKSRIAILPLTTPDGSYNLWRDENGSPIDEYSYFEAYCNQKDENIAEEQKTGQDTEFNDEPGPGIATFDTKD